MERSLPAPPSRPTVVVVGSINVDQVISVERLPLPGETLIGSSLTLLPGGKGANQAVAAARRGAATLLIGAVGDDAHAAAALTVLTSSDVDVSRVDVVVAPTGLAVINVSVDAENTIVVVPGANGTVDDAAVERHADVLADAAVVVLQGEIPASGIERAARLAGGRILLNLAPVIRVDPAVLRAADPLVVNEHEGALALQQLRPDRPVPVDHAEIVDALRTEGIPSVIMTRGAAGVIVADGSGVHVLPSPRVDAVDTSGAGDAFVGALGASLATGASLVEAARDAVRVGAFAVTGVGTQSSYPSLEDELPSVPASAQADADAAANADADANADAERGEAAS
ncbi:ribokinase [Planctomonas psychrotolerans]|uniref:ribokinase n=1 Tax=Planctomonas psychrotolerans TaxID=2528712 RepID=UPI00123A9126|nr:ribokinase [Planctomonas psychrotolerans]